MCGVNVWISPGLSKASIANSEMRYVEVISASACSKRVEAAAAACYLDPDRVKTLPAALIAAKA